MDLMFENIKKSEKIGLILHQDEILIIQGDPGDFTCAL